MANLIKVNLLWGFILFLLMTLSPLTYARQCIVNRGVIDIGSGTTKIKVAKINRCRKIILKTLFEKNLKISFQESLEHNHNLFDKKIIKIAISKLNLIKKTLKKYNLERMRVIATSAFRHADNAIKVTQIIKRHTNLSIKIISQRTEAKLGYLAAIMTKQTYQKKVTENPIVWDIGGGSMQMTFIDSNKKLQIYQGKLASVSFKNLIISKIQKKDITKISSPNPISKKDYLNAVSIVFEYAKNNIPKRFKQKIKSNPVVIGIGGVHFFSIASQVKHKKYNSKILKKTILSSLELNHDDLGGLFASTDLSNLILVKSFMKYLKIQSVQAIKVNLADSLLI